MEVRFSVVVVVVASWGLAKKGEKGGRGVGLGETRPELDEISGVPWYAAGQ